jgi:methionyl-tRNA synthetase
VQPIDGDGDAFTRFESRMARAYDLETFSIRQAAETIANLLGMLADRATIARADRGAKVGVVVSGLRRLAREIWPLTPRLGAELCAMLDLGDPAAARAGGCGEAAAVVPELVISRLIQAL